MTDARQRRRSGQVHPYAYAVPTHEKAVHALVEATPEPTSRPGFAWMARWYYWGSVRAATRASTDDAQRLDRRLRSAGALRRACAINEPKPLLVANADPHV